MNRKSIYYWKSDRPFAAENTRTTANPAMNDTDDRVRAYLRTHFRNDILHIKAAGGQGNHITYLVTCADSRYFIRLENGPEGDNYMAVASHVMERVKALGIPCPTVHLTDVSRTQVPFAIQVMDFVDSQDLARYQRANGVNETVIGFEIGRYVGQWQQIAPAGFGLFNAETLFSGQELEGYHASYRNYFFLNWQQHLHYLSQTGFLSKAVRQQVEELVSTHQPLLDIQQGCLVHKDLAFWNILSNGQQILAFIDWDDAISGDPVDDLSLLACFHGGALLSAAVEGYSSVRPLPDHFEKRFWLHLLRNMVFKAVIRVRGNYFDMPGSFFMNGGQQNNLKQITLDRIKSACRGLEGKQQISNL